MNYRNFNLKIDLGNDEMSGPEDVARVLRKVADRLMNDALSGVIMDDNGNKVGSWAVE